MEPSKSTVTAAPGQSLRRYLTTGTKPPNISDDDLALSLSEFIRAESKRSLKQALKFATQYAAVARGKRNVLELGSVRLLANMTHFSGKYPEAKKHYMRAIALAGRHTLLKARLNRAVADVFMYLGDSKESLRRIKSSLSHFRANNLTDDVAMTEVNLANIYHRQDRHIDAEALYRKAGDHFEKHNQELRLAHCCYNRANTLVQLFRMDEAEAAYRRAETIWRRHGHDLDVTEARYGLAWLMMLRGDFHVALTMLQECEERYTHAGNKRMAACASLIGLKSILVCICLPMPANRPYAPKKHSHRNENTGVQSLSVHQ